MKEKHTPGPWVIHQKKTVLSYDLMASRMDHMEGKSVSPDEHEANATLIAAAPDLLAALEQSLMALIGYQHQNEITKAAQNSARAAIAKARGES